MATRTVDLGTVGFGLEANTATLAASLRTLKAFGQAVNNVGNQAGWADPLYKKFTQIERTLTGIHSQVSRTTQRMREAGVAAAEIDKIEQAYRRLNRTLTHQAAGLGPAEMNRGVTGMRAMLAQGNRMAGAQEASKFALAFRDLERAAILAVGPLSGVGARLAVLSALFESTGAKMTLFIAGMTGFLAGFSFLAFGAVKATMDMERFNAMLEASTGAAVLAAKEYEYVKEVAARLGQNVRSLVEPYAKFTTAARLSNLSMEDQRHIFEGAMTAGTAMKISSERMGLVFLALEQMVSKGVVSMEELRRQLGDLLPGSMALAAQAMRVTEPELIRMIEAGDVLAKDLLPLLAQKWLDVFGPAAASAARTLQAEIARLGTSSFELLKAFNDATRVSEAFRKVVIATRQALDFLSGSMREVVALLGALAGGSIMIGVIASWGRIAAGAMAAATAIRTATTYFQAFGVAAAALVLPGLGGVVALLVRLGLVAAGAAVGYQFLNREQETSITGTREWLKSTEDWIFLQHKLGISHRQTTQEMMQGTASRLRMTYAEIGATQAQVVALRIQREAQLRNLERSMRTDRGFDTMKRGGAFDVSKDEQVLEMIEKEQRLKDLAANLESVIRQIQALAVESPPGADTTGGPQFQNWIKGIQQSIREVQGLEEQIKAFTTSGKDAAIVAEGMAKAIEKMADMPGKKAGALEKIRAELAAAGFHGKELKDQLAELFTEIEKRKEALKVLENLPQQFKTASEAAGKMFDDLKARREAALESDPQNMTSQERLAKSLVTLRAHYATMKLDQADINRLVAEYTTLWGQTERIEANSKSIKSLREEIERLDDQLGDSHEKAVKKYLDRMRTIVEAQDRGVLDQVRAARMSREAADEMYRHMLDRTTFFGRAMNEMFRDLERGISRTLAQMTLRQKVSFRDLLMSMAQQVLEFSYQVSVVQPAMKALFGGAYTRNSGDAGTGLLEGGLMKMAQIFGASFGTQDASSITGPYGGFSTTDLAFGDYGMSLYDTMYMGGFATGGSFDVGGSGGMDSSLVAFHATPGEHVDVTPAGGSSGRGVNIVVNNNTGMQMEATQQPGSDPEQIIVDLFFRRLSRDAGARSRLQQMTSAPRH